jgi:hypothetical protein
MKYLGNYQDWIQTSWIDDILSIQGFGAPKDFNIDKEIALGQRSTMHESERTVYKVYGTDKIFFYLLESKCLDFDIQPPWLNERFDWWVTKMYPGQFIPVHSDGPKHLKGKRYWMPLQDWQPGHIFMYEDISITKYTAGDLWEYEDSLAIHGAINIGHSPRLILQVSTTGETV